MLSRGLPLSGLFFSLHKTQAQQAFPLTSPGTHGARETDFSLSASCLPPTPRGPRPPGPGSKHPWAPAPQPLIEGVGRPRLSHSPWHVPASRGGDQSVWKARFPRAGGPGQQPRAHPPARLPSGRPSADCRLRACPLTPRGGEGFPWGLW